MKRLFLLCVLLFCFEVAAMSEPLDPDPRELRMLESIENSFSYVREDFKDLLRMAFGYCQFDGKCALRGLESFRKMFGSGYNRKIVVHTLDFLRDGRDRDIDFRWRLVLYQNGINDENFHEDRKKSGIGIDWIL